MMQRGTCISQQLNGTAMLLLVCGIALADDGGLPALDVEMPDTIQQESIDRVLDEVVAKYPPEDFDIDVLAKRLGEDPQSSFEYVRDNIGFDPYPGVLRGSEGTLAARAGNHFDRALLLKDLFEKQGVTARLARGQIAAKSAGLLKKRAAEATATIAGEDPALHLAGLGGPMYERLRARAERDYQWLSDALIDKTEDVTPQDGADIERADHVWVQARVFGEWVDFDPTLKTSSPGDTLAYFEKAFNEPGNADYHEVIVNVIAESIDANGQSKKTSVLNKRLRASDVDSSHIVLFFQPGVESAGIGGAVVEAVGMERRFVPMIMVDGEVTQGQSMPPMGLPPESDGEAFFDVTSGLSLLAGVELELSSQVPGQGVRRDRTILLDRVSPADRATRSLDPKRLNPQTLINGQPAFYAGVHQVLISTGSSNPLDAAVSMTAIINELADPLSADEFSEQSFDQMIWPFAELNSSLVLSAERLSFAQLNNSPGTRFFVGRPRAYRVSVDPGQRGDGEGALLKYDLVHDHLSWYARRDNVAPLVVEARLRYGTLQSALETTLAELRSLDDSGIGEVRSASSLTRQSLRPVLPVQLNGAADRGFSVGLRDDIRQYFVLTSLEDSKPIEAWWRFDRKDGSLVARLAPALGGTDAYIFASNYSRATNAGGVYVSRLDANPNYAMAEQSQYRQARAARLAQERGIPTKAQAARSCKGGTEYIILFGCVSLPASISVGWAHVMIYGHIATTTGIVLMIVDLNRIYTH